MIDRITLSARPSQLELLDKLKAQGEHITDTLAFARDGVSLYASDNEGLRTIGPNGDKTTLLASEKDLYPVGPLRERPDGSLVLFRGSYRYSMQMKELTSVTPDGSRRWTVPVDREEGRGARFLQDQVVLRGEQNIRAISLDNGVELWNHPLPRFTRTCAAPDGSTLVAGDGEVYRLTTEGKQVSLPLSNLPKDIIHRLYAGQDGSVILDQGQVRCYNPDGSVRWTREKDYGGVPLAETPEVLYRHRDHSLEGLDPTTGAKLWQVDGYSLDEQYHQDEKGRLRYRPVQNYGELWTVDARGGVQVQKLPEGVSSADPMQLMPDGSTFFNTSRGTRILPPPEAGEAKTAFRTLQEATVRVTGLSLEELSHLQPEEHREAYEGARHILVQRRSAVDRALSSRTSCDDAEQPFLQEHKEFVALIKDPELTPEARTGAFQTWRSRAAVQRWGQLLFSDGPSS